MVAAVARGRSLFFGYRPGIAIGPERLARQRDRRGAADRVARRRAELERFQPPAEDIDVVDGLRALVAAIEHTRLVRVGAVALAERDVLGPQRDAHRIARRDRLQERGLRALALPEVDRAELAVAREERPGELVRRAGEVGDEEIGGAIVDL